MKIFGIGIGIGVNKQKLSESELESESGFGKKKLTSQDPSFNQSIIAAACDYSFYLFQYFSFRYFSSFSSTFLLSIFFLSSFFHHTILMRSKKITFLKINKFESISSYQFTFFSQKKIFLFVETSTFSLLV
jgi:hypothetical protein